LLWWTWGEVYLGCLSIRHTLVGPWERSGHIGYDIRRSASDRGHATAIPCASLLRLGGLGIDPAVVCVGEGNFAQPRGRGTQRQRNGAVAATLERVAAFDPYDGRDEQVVVHSA
jgi:hypothetical protein